MKREIKFRAWDKLSKRFIDTVYIHQDGLLWKDTDPHGVDMSGARRITASESLISNDRVDIMQYTGLKDKNGKECYEGDIVKSVKDNLRIPDTAVIKWDNKYAAFIQEFSINDDNMMDVPFEIIGNIHENPELL